MRSAVLSDPQIEVIERLNYIFTRSGLPGQNPQPRSQRAVRAFSGFNPLLLYLILGS